MIHDGRFKGWGTEVNPGDEYTSVHFVSHTPSIPALFQVLTPELAVAVKVPVSEHGPSLNTFIFEFATPAPIVIMALLFVTVLPSVSIMLTVG